MAEDEEFAGEEMQVAPGVMAPVDPIPAQPPGESDEEQHYYHEDEAEEMQRLEGALGSDPDAAGDSIARAAFYVEKARDWSSRADLYRKSPKEYKGVKVSGFIERFEHPFDVSDIEVWARKHRGGGVYELRMYDGRKILRKRHTFECEGRVILEGEVPGEEMNRPGAAPGLQQSAQATDEVAKLREEMQRREHEAQLERERFRHQQEMDRVNAKIDALTEALNKPEESKTNLTDLATALGPIALQLMQMQQANANALRDMQMQQAAAQAEQAQNQMNLILTLQEKSESRQADILKLMTGKKETLGDAIKAMAELRKVTGADDNPAKMYHTLMQESVPVLLSTMSRIELHKAGIREDGGGEDQPLSAMLVDRVSGLAEALITSRGEAAQAAPPAHYPGVAPPAMPPGIPTAAPAPGAAAPPGNPIVTPEQQAALEYQAAQAAQAAENSASPQAAPASGNVPQQAQGAINLELFVRALKYMREGQAGSALADDIIGEEEANATANPQGPHLYLAPRVVQFLVNTSPNGVLAVLNPHLRSDPRFKELLDPIGQEFLKDFCLYFSEPDEGGEGGEEEGADAAPAGADGSRVAPEDPAADITGGAVNPEEPTGE